MVAGVNRLLEEDGCEALEAERLRAAIECTLSVPYVGDFSTSRNSLVALPVSVIKKSWRCYCNIFKCLNAATMLNSVFDLVILYQVC
jgi:hypothetical protein